MHPNRKMAYTAGYNTSKGKSKKSENPFEEDTLLWVDWKDGFADANKKMKKPDERLEKWNIPNKD